MRWLAFMLVLAGCDPVWHITNPATMRTSGDAQCIERGLRTLNVKVERAGEIAQPNYGWYLGDLEQGVMEIVWTGGHPDRIEVEMRGVGTEAPAGATDEYRRLRDAAIEAIQQTCGPIEVGPETCARMTCAAAK
jgi:hypothetical protein